MDMTHAFDLAAEPVGFHHFTSDVSINFQCNRWAQWIGPHAVSDLQEVATAPTVSAWVGRFAQLERAAADSGRTLDAAYYARAAQFFYAPDDPRRPSIRKRVVRTLQEAFAIQPVDVPYMDSSLPAYDLRPLSQPTGTWVFFGGFDSYIEELFPLLAAVVARGRRVIAFDVLPDFLAANLSQLSPRLAGPLVSRLLLRLPGPILDAMAGARRTSPIVDWGLMQGLFVTGTSTVAEYLRCLEKYATARVSPLVTQKVLLLQGYDDHYVPRRQLADQAASLTRARSVTTRRFTAAESASAHVQVGNIGLAFQTMLAWEDAVRDK
jgi:hypothetical protein